MNELQSLMVERLFDQRMILSAPHFDCRREYDSDTNFLAALFIQTSPLRDLLPHAILVQQAQMAEQHFRAHHAHAMRRIICCDGQSAGRFIVNWQDAEASHCVDIAVTPAFSGHGIGTALLTTWIDVATQLGVACRLEVQVSNPALRLYTRLGFVPRLLEDINSPVIVMEHPA